MSGYLIHIGKLLTGLGIVISLVNLSVVIWETNLVFAEINEETENPVEDETTADYTISLMDTTIPQNSLLSMTSTQGKHHDSERLSGHFEIDSPPPEVCA